MKDGISKRELIKRLNYLVKCTIAGEEVKILRLSKDENTVKIIWKSGCCTNVNIECDSGMAIIRDVCSKIN